MATRPSEIAKWAEGPNENVQDASVFQQRGFQDPDSFSSAYLNWILNLYGNWIQYLDDKFQGSEGAVSFPGGIDYGDKADVSLASDAQPLWEAVFTHADGGDNRARWKVDQLEANWEFIGTDIKGSFGSDNLVGVNTLTREDGSFDRGDGGFLLNILQQNTSDGVNFRSAGGADYEGGIHAGFARSGYTDAQGVDRFPIKNPNDSAAPGTTPEKLEANAIVDALNTSKATALATDLSGTPTVTRSVGMISGTSGITRQSAGVYDFDLTHAVQATTPSDVVHGEVQIVGDDGTDNTIYDSRIRPLNSSTIRVRILDSSGETDPATGKISVSFKYE